VINYYFATATWLSSLDNDSKEKGVENLFQKI
jgi:hypothetical protein